MGVAHAWVLGTSVYSAFGPGAYVLVCLYFVFGSAVRTFTKMIQVLQPSSKPLGSPAHYGRNFSAITYI